MPAIVTLLDGPVIVATRSKRATLPLAHAVEVVRATSENHGVPEFQVPAVPQYRLPEKADCVKSIMQLNAKSNVSLNVIFFMVVIYDYRFVFLVQIYWGTLKK